MLQDEEPFLAPHQERQQRELPHRRPLRRDGEELGLQLLRQQLAAQLQHGPGKASTRWSGTWLGKDNGNRTGWRQRTPKWDV